jgi:acetoacetyl-CoA synthetase
MSQEPQPLWAPSESLKQNSNLQRYINWLGEKKNLHFIDYDSLWAWSVGQSQAFWETLWQYFEIVSSGDYEDVLQKPASGMIGTKWFEGAKINYAEHIFRNANNERPAIIFKSEQNTLTEISWEILEDKVAKLLFWLRANGLNKGDRVCSLLPNIPEAVIAFLAVNAAGAVWSSCSPDFGNASIEDRFVQIEPKFVFIPDGYTYNGKVFEKLSAWQQLQQLLPTVEKWIQVPFINTENRLSGSVMWQETMGDRSELSFERVPFDFPLWILFSSGTTGKPKAITHSVGGCLIEHLKALALHQDVKPGERYFWYSTTGWMMWNYSLASMLCGATLVLYEGSAGYPDIRSLWHYAKESEMNHFGGGAAYYIACMKADVKFGEDEFPDLRTIGSTGSPLPPEAFHWIYEKVKKDVWLISLSGGTDICSCFVGGNPFLPVYEGEIQCRLLGCALDAWDEEGNPVREDLGEMVITRPMPSMPIYFWNDDKNIRYQSSYFEQYPGVWRHGDWIAITKRNTIVIYGRSDATLNRDGVRIGTSEVYRAVEGLPEVADSIVVCIERPGGIYFMPLFVVLKSGYELNESLIKKINTQLRSQYSPRHVPNAIYQINEVPYTISGKKMEAPVKKILMGIAPDAAASPGTMKNPGAMEQFLNFR